MNSSSSSEQPLTLTHQAVWRGEELLSRTDWMHELTVEELKEISNAHDSTTTDINERIAPRLYQRLSRIQNSLENGCGAAFVRGLDSEGYDREKLASLFLKICSRVGTPLSQSAAGEKVFSVRNEGFNDDDPRTRGPNTRKKLSFHTDRCDVIAFLCLQQARSGGENQVVSSMAIYNQLATTRPDLLEQLMQPYFYQRHNVDLGNESAYTQQPIFSVYKGHFAANFLRVLIERAYASEGIPGMTDLQREALDEVDRIANDPDFHLTFTQQKGDMLFLNNWVTFHRRNEFEDHPEMELRRHLLRIWLSVPNSRPIDPLFAGNYGATAAGAIRGGMKAQES